MLSALRPLRWALAGGLLSALVLASSGGATHAGNFQIGHTNVTPVGETTATTCNTSNNCFAVLNSGAGDNPVVYGTRTSSSGTGPGVWGSTDSSSVGASGVFGELDAAAPNGNSAGVRGTVSAATNVAYGVWGSHTSVDGTAAGVLGNTASNDANAVGLHGTIVTTNPGAGSKAIWGYNAGTSDNGYGVFGEQQGSGVGVVGQTPSGVGTFGLATSSAGVGVVGYSPAPGLAGFFAGNVFVSGTLGKSAGGFRIDHPLQPDAKYLHHSFVESPDMKNVYDGVVRTDRRGYATVRLPRYFAALNRSFRYQLTIVGRSFAQAIVWKEIAANRFTIKTNRPRTKVSWQVTGIRQDRYANANRIVAEVSKTAADRRTDVGLARLLRERK